MKLRQKVSLFIIFFVFLNSFVFTLYLTFQHYDILIKHALEHMDILSHTISINVKNYFDNIKNKEYLLNERKCPLDDTLDYLKTSSGLSFVVILDNNKRIVKFKCFDKLNESDNWYFSKINNWIEQRKLWNKDLKGFFIYKSSIHPVYKDPDSPKLFVLKLKYFFHKKPKQYLPLIEKGTKIKIAKNEYAYIEMAMSTKYIQSTIWKNLWQLVIPLFIIFIFIIVLALLFTNHITKAVSILSQGAEKLSMGELDHRITLKSNDELGNWARTFNLMAENLQKTLNELSLKYKETQRLFEQATTDGLTKVYDHSYLIKLLKRELYLSNKEKEPLSFIMCDIDLFKKFNDNYGHQAGDYVLMTLAKILKESVRKNIDIVGRYGGEEFGIILPGTDDTGAMKVAEKLRKTIEEYYFEFEGNNLKVTMSFGVTSAKSGDITLEEIIKLADKALYMSKNAGKNKVSYLE